MTDLKNLNRRDFGRLSVVAIGGAIVGPSCSLTKHSGAVINGTVAPGFERVRDAFAENFELHGEVGAACSAYYRGNKVVDLWGGIADVATGRAWSEDTIIGVASSTKGATAICANLLAQEGELDMDAPVAYYWPEFAAAGKKDIPVRWLLSHRVGLPVFDKPITIEEYLSWEAPVKALAAQKPVWDPGTTHGYHAGTYGWLVGEVVRRISGKSLGRFFADEVAGPLGLDFWIGLPESEEDRVVQMIQLDLTDPNIEAKGQRAREMLAAATKPKSYLTNPLTTTPIDPSSRAYRAAEQPAGNGITDARSLARMYASLIGNGVDGVRLFTDETVRLASTEQSNGKDEVIGLRTRFGLGFYLFIEGSNMIQEGVFGHGGAGGSLGFADPKAEIGFGYVMNKMQVVADDDPRTVGLVQAVHDSIKG